MTLTACGGGTVLEEKFETALDPQRHAPTNHWRDWKPSGSRKSEVADIHEASITPPGNQLVESSRTYELVDLVNLGLRSNPQTRGAWESARAAASGVGIAEAYWLPVLSASMLGGYRQYPFPSPGSAFSLKGTSVDPTFTLSWILFDKGRSARIDQANQNLFASNFSLNRVHQKVAYDIQKNFYGLLSARARVEAAELTLKQTTRNVESIQSHFDQGLATKPELLMAVQDQAKAGYELQGAHGMVWQKQAELAESLGITPNVSLKTIEMKDVILPGEIENSADQIIDRALENRPDLSAKLAELRSREAEIRKAEATYWPTLTLNGEAGYKMWNYQNAEGSSGGNVHISVPLYGGFLTMNWNIFEGFAGVNAIGQAEANRNAAQAQFDALQLQIIRDVWKAFAELKTSARKREFALAMLKAAEKSYESALDTYQQGVTTVIELITAERNLAVARYTEIESKAGVLESAAALVYASGNTETAP